MRRKNSVFCMVLVLIAGLLVYEVLVSHGSTYYYTSLGIILLSLIVFFFHFEQGKPSVILLTMIASLCALAIVSRIAFFFLPQIKPMIAIVILAGVSFGAEAGFVTGAVSAFVSNFYFGQGSWTPFQMFALGIIGGLAGILFAGRKCANWLLVLYGFFSALIVYGGIVDLNTIFFTSQELNPTVVLGVYASAVPFNLLTGTATAVFLALLKKPIVKRIRRIQGKYCLIDKEGEKEYDN